MSEITYRWELRPNIGVTYNENNLQNIVNWVRWDYKGYYTPTGETEPTLYRSISETTHFDAPSSQNFTTFENLTEEIIIGWLETKLGQEYITDMQLKISSSLMQDLQPKTGVLSAPWN